MPQLCTDEYPAGRWSNKCRGGWGNTYEKPRDEENCPPNLDYKVIEQIADGVEKMILAWSHGEERGAHAPRSPVTNAAASSRTSVMKGSQKPMKMKSPLSEKRFQGEAGCNYVCPVQLQDLPGGVTAEISINGNCHGAGMGSAISQIVSQAVKHTGNVSNKDIHAEKTVTETATYWYLEASNATNQGCRGSSRENERKPESSSRIGGSGDNPKQSCCPEKGGREGKSWTEEEKYCRSFSRSGSEGRPEGSPTLSNQSTPQRSDSRDHRGSRQNKLKDVESLRSYSSGGAEQPWTSKKATRNSTPQGETQSGPRHPETKVKETVEVPRLPRVNLGPSRISCLNGQIGSVIVDDELLEKKLAALTTMPPTPLMEGEDLTDEDKLRQCQDLQIALLECAMEYEIKTIELKIKLKSLQSTPKHSDDFKSGCAEKDQTHYNKNSRESQIVESMKKQLFKLQREKGAVTKEYLSLQKKERKFEVQKRNLEDALVRVNRLQRELVRKDQELMDCQLMEKHIQAKLQEAEAHVKTSHRSPEPPPGVEPAKLVALLPSLREWVKTLKKDRANEPAMIKLMEGYCMKGEPNRTEPFRPRSANERLLHSDGSRKEFETVVHSLVKEVQALQKELGKLGSRSWKHKNQSLPAWRNGLENRQGGRLATGGSPPYTFKRLYTR
ncbi:unnamed protein product [Calypogeia fissa]